MPKRSLKKGIAPLIATLLLLSFAVAVGVVVMNLGRAQVELGAQCAIDIGLKDKGICFDQSTGQIRFTVVNGINVKVEGLLVNIIGSSSAATSELNSIDLLKAGTYSTNVAYDQSTSGQIRQLRIAPKVILFDQELICSEQAIIAENVANC